MDPTCQDDADLMAAVADGDTAALGVLVHRYQDKALALAYRLLGRLDQAEDVAQEAFLRVHRSARRYRPSARFGTWLYRIVVNLCHDVHRRAGYAPVALADPAAAAVAPPANAVEAAERADRVRRAILALPGRQRTAVVLLTYEGLSHRQIAELTGWSASAVESLIVRAYANLRRRLAEWRQSGD